MAETMSMATKCCQRVLVETRATIA